MASRSRQRILLTQRSAPFRLRSNSTAIRPPALARRSAVAAKPRRVTQSSHADLAGIWKHPRFAGERIDGRRADQSCRAGVGRTFQLVKPFVGLTVMENVIVGALNSSASVREAKAKAAEVIEQLGLAGKRDQMAASLTLPERKRLEVARALATGPRLLLLDEVMAGLRPTETDHMVALFRELNTKLGLTILLIEHVMRAVMALSSRLIVLHHGQVIAAGTPAEVTHDPAVLECYLGEEAV